MKTTTNVRAVYLYFPIDAANIERSIEELGRLSRALCAEENADLYRQVVTELMNIKREHARKIDGLQSTARKRKDENHD